MLGPRDLVLPGIERVERGRGIAAIRDVIGNPAEGVDGVDGPPPVGRETVTGEVERTTVGAGDRGAERPVDRLVTCGWSSRGYARAVHSWSAGDERERRVGVCAGEPDHQRLAFVVMGSICLSCARSAAPQQNMLIRSSSMRAVSKSKASVSELEAARSSGAAKPARSAPRAIAVAASTPFRRPPLAMIGRCGEMERMAIRLSAVGIPQAAKAAQTRRSRSVGAR